MILDYVPFVYLLVLTFVCLNFLCLFLCQRKWKNDANMAVRDCYNARRIDSSSFRAHNYMSEALSQVILVCAYIKHIILSTNQLRKGWEVNVQIGNVL